MPSSMSYRKVVPCFDPGVPLLQVAILQCLCDLHLRHLLEQQLLDINAYLATPFLATRSVSCSNSHVLATCSHT